MKKLGWNKVTHCDAKNPSKTKKNILFFSKFIVTPANLEKPIKLQLPIMLATYPLRNEDGTMKRNRLSTEYPTTLPIFRPWLDEKTFQ